MKCVTQLVVTVAAVLSCLGLATVVVVAVPAHAARAASVLWCLHHAESCRVLSGLTTGPAVGGTVVSKPR